MCLKNIIKTNYSCLRLTKLYNILLLYYYWPLVSASMDHHQANIYKKLKNAGVYFTYWPDDGQLRLELVAKVVKK